MRAEHFVYGLFNGVGYKTLQTSRVDKLLTEQNFERLKRLPAADVVYVHWLDTENIVAITQVREAKDEFNRKGIWNHTILVPITEYLSYTSTQPASHITDSLFQKLPLAHAVLEPIEIK